MKIRPVESELFHADGRTDGRADMTKLIVAFRNFAKAPKKRVQHIRASGPLPDRLTPVIFIGPPPPKSALVNLLQLHVRVYVLPTDIKPTQLHIFSGTFR
jgi:hypothetical protein